MARSRCPRQRRAQDEVAVLVRSVLELAAGQRDALGQADEPGARAPARAGDGTPTGRLLTTATTSGGPSSCEIATSTAAAGACLRAFVSPSWTTR